MRQLCCAVLCCAMHAAGLPTTLCGCCYHLPVPSRLCVVVEGANGASSRDAMPWLKRGAAADWQWRLCLCPVGDPCFHLQVDVGGPLRHPLLRQAGLPSRAVHD